MIPNTTSVPDFNNLQHRPRKCKLLWSELVAKYSPEGIQFSVLAKSFESLKAAPRVSALEAFIHGQGVEKQGLYRWCPGALAESSTAECACPSSLRQPKGRFQMEDTHCKQALGKGKSFGCRPCCEYLSTAGDLIDKYAEQTKYMAYI